MKDYKTVSFAGVGPAADRPVPIVTPSPPHTSNYFKSFYEVSQLRIGGSQFYS